MTLASNPFTYFVTGSNEREFTYAPGKTAYTVVFNLGNWYPFRAMIWADDLGHAMGILKALTTFRLECGREYQEYEADDPHRRHTGLQDAGIDLFSDLECHLEHGIATRDGKTWQLTVEPHDTRRAVKVAFGHDRIG